MWILSYTVIWRWFSQKIRSCTLITHLPKLVIIEIYQNTKNNKSKPSPQTICIFIRVPTLTI